ncbi:peptidase [Erwinia psidii]|uniref:Peptidase n=1 Tax=Erwinia psidii TaxID=69224 RepID=A0A3N6SJ95_9GAMM|nr:peptidase [Erwinia psidii]MCX8961052.1 peptidase [Erwinia psidii]MCX8965520.1 peptidase [Erwinia psidii]RQM38851.1 peptidase [Erwinia psidii]
MTDTSQEDPVEKFTKRTKSQLGYIPDIPDIRDFHYRPDETLMRQLPSSVDLTPAFPVYNQGRIGSCTANALAGAVQYERAAHDESPDFIPSRLFIYYNERVIEGSVDYDSGAMLRDGIKTLHKVGVCPEERWPYDDTSSAHDGGAFPAEAPARKKPNAACYQEASGYVITHYERVHQDLTHLKTCLAGGTPFVFGFIVYDNWMNNTHPPATQIPMPGKEDKPVGGHAVLCVGYDDSTQLFRIRNSWGEDVGDRGYFFIPYDYLTRHQLASDFWVIYAVRN